MAQGVSDEETHRLVERLPPDSLDLPVNLLGPVAGIGLAEHCGHPCPGAAVPYDLVPGRAVRFRLVAEDLGVNLADVSGSVETSRQPVVGELMLDPLLIHELREMWQPWVIRKRPHDRIEFGQM